MNVRNSDPDTSGEAFASVAIHIGKLHNIILSHLMAESATASEVMERTGLLYNTAWRRLSELKHMGLAANTKGRRRNPRNRNEVVVAVTDAGRVHLEAVA